MSSAGKSNLLPILVIFLIGVAIIPIFLLLVSLFQTSQAVQAIKNGQLDKAQSRLELAKNSLSPLSILAKTSKTLAIYPQFIDVATPSLEIIQAISNQSTAIPTGFSLHPLLPPVKEFNQKLAILNKNLSEPSFVTNRFPFLIATINQLSNFTSTFTPYLQQLLTGQHRLVIMLANSNEIRPTGGFTGSYALLTLTDGVISDLIVEDIYEADGQFQGFVDPPPGVKEYLSSGKGWRLPDANWHVDHPASAQQQIWFLERGGRENIDALITLNLDFFERILAVTGPIWLPDYDQYLTAESLDDVLENRDEYFFAGSRVKSHMLQTAMNQLILKLSQLSPAQGRSLIEQIMAGFQTKEIQIYHTNPAIQLALEKLNVTGSWPSDQPAIALVDANVGINKINKFVTRSVDLAELPGNQLVLNASWNNSADPTASRSAYINYARLIYPSDWQLQSLTVDNQSIETTSENLNYSGQNLTSTNFLLELPAQSTATLSAVLQTPNFSSDIELINQAGTN